MSENSIVRGLTGSRKNYKLIHDAYNGAGGYADGSYLEQYAREAAEDYERRKRMAYFANYVKPIVNGSVDPIFREYPSRDCKSNNELWAAFLNNCDGKGSSLDRFIKKAALQAKLDGSVFLFMENAREADIAANLETAIGERQYPYLFRIAQKDVINYSVDRFDRLLLFCYQKTYDELAEDGKVLTVSESWKWTPSTWEVTRNGVKTEGVHKLGVIPVIPLIGSDTTDEEEGDKLKPQSDFVQAVKVNNALYNACSELRQRNRGQAFSLLTYGIPDDANPSEFKEMLTGVNNALMYKGNNAPNWITPDQAPSDMLQEEIKMLVEVMYRMADRVSVTGVQEQKSGVAKEWDNLARMQSLSEFSKACEAAEYRIADIFGAYINQKLDVLIKYAEGFGVTDTKSALDEITAALELQIGGKFDVAVKKKAARIVLKDEDDAVISEVSKDIEKLAENEAYDNDGDDDKE